MQQAVSSEAPKAGFWIRFVAYFLDGLIVGIPGLILVFIAAAISRPADGQPTGQVSGLVIVVYALWIIAGIAYFVYFWTRPEGQTLGMKALHLRVVKTDGSQLTMGSAILRYIGMIVNSIIFGLPIGWIWAGFDKNKQGWHDKIAGTYVVKTG
jgi:uncharacterized RDD family membrane protein YckC